jgi:hypothetical protein
MTFDAHHSRYCVIAGQQAPTYTLRSTWARTVSRKSSNFSSS